MGELMKRNNWKKLYKDSQNDLEIVKNHHEKVMTEIRNTVGYKLGSDSEVIQTIKKNKQNEQTRIDLLSEIYELIPDWTMKDLKDRISILKKSEKNI
jgi:hypothetical protein